MGTNGCSKTYPWKNELTDAGSALSPALQQGFKRQHKLGDNMGILQVGTIPIGDNDLYEYIV